MVVEDYLIINYIIKDNSKMDIPSELEAEAMIRYLQNDNGMIILLMAEYI